ncbi:hypothetical protein PR048_031108 [Dryococelus australis]|uniref:Uncharacterized protein n=1 Tax=Dryococelus australis TaxID=614101 RepID=A0ABQ9G4C9_9NEOP|nr:hypothetical protein PR048_031108 [Dryococelus australis]
MWSDRVVKLLAFHQGEPDSIPGRVTPGFSLVGIVPDDLTAGRRVFSGSHVSPPPSHSGRCSILTSYHPHRLSDRVRFQVYTCELASLHTSLTRGTKLEGFVREKYTTSYTCSSDSTYDVTSGHKYAQVCTSEANSDTASMPRCLDKPEPLNDPISSPLLLPKSRDLSRLSLNPVRCGFVRRSLLFYYAFHLATSYLGTLYSLPGLDNPSAFIISALIPDKKNRTGVETPPETSRMAKQTLAVSQLYQKALSRALALATTHYDVSENALWSSQFVGESAKEREYRQATNCLSDVGEKRETGCLNSQSEAALSPGCARECSLERVFSELRHGLCLIRQNPFLGAHGCGIDHNLSASRDDVTLAANSTIDNLPPRWTYIRIAVRFYLLMNPAIFAPYAVRTLFANFPLRSAPINEHLPTVCPNHVQFCQEGSGITFSQQPMRKRRRLEYKHQRIRPCCVMRHRYEGNVERRKALGVFLHVTPAEMASQKARCTDRRNPSAFGYFSSSNVFQSTRHLSERMVLQSQNDVAVDGTLNCNHDSSCKKLRMEIVQSWGRELIAGEIASRQRARHVEDDLPTPFSNPLTSPLVENRCSLQSPGVRGKVGDADSRQNNRPSFNGNKGPFPRLHGDFSALFLFLSPGRVAVIGPKEHITRPSPTFRRDQLYLLLLCSSGRTSIVDIPLPLLCHHVDEAWTAIGSFRVPHRGGMKPEAMLNFFPSIVTNLTGRVLLSVRFKVYADAPRTVLNRHTKNLDQTRSSVGSEFETRFGISFCDVIMVSESVHVLRTCEFKQGQEARERYGRHSRSRLVPHRSYAQGVQCFRPNALPCKPDL